MLAVPPLVGALLVVGLQSLGAVAAPDAEADLALALSGPAGAAPGGSARYTLWITNTGPAAAAAVVVYHALPPPLRFVAATDGGVEAEPGTVRWSVGSLSPSAARRLTLHASVPVTAAVGRVLNRAWVGSAVPDPRTGDNEAQWGTDILPVDLRAEIGTTAVEARPGERITHTVTVANASAVAAEGVLLRVDLAPRTAWAHDDAPEGATPFTRSLGAGTVTWYRPALAGPSSRQLQLVTRVDEAAPPGTVLAHAVTVASVTVDSHPANNSATSAALTVRWPDLWLTKSGPAELAVGGQAAYNLRYGNRGPGGAPNVVVRDVLPPELELLSSLPPATVAAGGALSWRLGELGAGTEGMLRVWARLAGGVAPGRVVRNEARIASAATDLSPPDNTSHVVSAVVAGAPHELVMQAPEWVAVGGASDPVLVEVRDVDGHWVADGTAVLFDTDLGRLEAASLVTRQGKVTNTFTSGNLAGTARLSARAGAVTALREIAVAPGAVDRLDITVQPAAATVGQTVTVRVLVRDRFGNPVRDGTPVRFVPQHGTVRPQSAATTSGGAEVGWASSRSGPARLTVESGDRSAEAVATFLPDVPATIALAAGSTRLPVDDGRATVRAVVTDRFGNPVADGLAVAFAAGGGRVNPVAANTVAGAASTTFYAGPVPGSARVSARAGDAAAHLDLELAPTDLVVSGRLDGPRGRARESRTYPGEPLTYTVAVRNQGLAVARGAHLAVGLPLAFTVSRVDAPAGVAETNDPPPGLGPDVGHGYVDRAWRLPDLDSGRAITLTLSGKLSRAAAWSAFQTLFARSVVTTTTAEASVFDLVHSDQAGVHAADHRVTVALNYIGSVPQPGGRLMYEISFANQTSGTDGVVWITNTLPAYTTYDNWSPAMGTEARAAHAFHASSRELVWEVDGQAALSGRLRLWLDVAPDAPPQSVVRNVVTIGASVFDYDLDNNVSHDSVWLHGVNLVASAEAPDAVAPGDAYTVLLRVANDALRDAATNVVVAARPPAGTRLVRTEPPALLTADGGFSWRREVLAAGGELELEATFEVPSSAATGSVLRFEAEAASDQLESYPADNRVVADTRVQPGPPWSLRLQASGTELSACTSDALELEARVRDRHGNPVADGTVVSWSARPGELSADRSVTAAGVATVRLAAGRRSGSGVVGAESGAAADTLAFTVVPGPPRALALSADPRVVHRGGRTRLTTSVLDACGNEVLDGWPIRLTAERGQFEGAAGTVALPTLGGAVRATLLVGDAPGPLRVTARHGNDLGETMVSVAERRPGILVPYAGR